MTKGTFIAIITAVGTATASIASVVAVARYWTDRPAVLARSLDVSISPKSRWTDARAELQSIEDRYSDVTRFGVIGLLNFVGALSERDDNLEDDGQQEFEDRLQSTISDYRDQKDEIEDQNRSRRLEHVIDDLKNLNDTFDEVDHRRLNVKIILMNHSRSDNTIVGKAALRMSNSENQRTGGFQLEHQGDVHLGAYSMTTLSFQSNFASDLDPAHRDFIADIAERVKLADLWCQVAVKDVHENIWTSEEAPCSRDYDWQRLYTAVGLTAE